MGKLVLVMLSVLVPCACLAEPFDYMSALRKAEANLAAAEQSADKSRVRFTQQMLATEQSMVGDTERAIATYHSLIKRVSGTPLGAAVDVDAASFLADHEVRDALAAIVEQARDRQIVMINEAHHVPRDRAFASRVALELRKLGFRYLAMETLAEGTDDLAARGYATSSEGDGYYSREPVFGDFIRRALAAGYVLVAYEQMAPADVKDPNARIEAREEGQAQNLVDRVLAQDPQARILMHVGSGHLRKGLSEASGGRKVAWMAERLRVKTGIDPFCIDQTQYLPVNATSAAILAAHPFDVFALRSRTAANPYSETTAVDLFVYHRPAQVMRGRPEWLSMQGYRSPRKIPAKLLPESGRRLIQAFVANESADAVPMDQMLVTAGETPPVLMLPKGKFRFVVQD